MAFTTDQALVPEDTNGVSDVYLRDRDADDDGIFDEPEIGDSVTSRLSVGSGGKQADAASGGPAISGNGRFVAFHSSATNLVDGDTNDTDDVFVRDVVDGTTERVSLTAGQGQQNGSSQTPSISDDGRFVAYVSTSTDAVAGDRDSRSDVYRYDRVDRVTTLVSVSSTGRKANRAASDPTVSADGAWVAFVSSATSLVTRDTNRKGDVFLHQVEARKTTRVSVSTRGGQAKGVSTAPAISDNGRFVAFVSSAPNLAAKDSNKAPDVFVRDRVKQTTRRVSVRGRTQAAGASAEPSISGDGKVVAYSSSAANLVKGDRNGEADVFVTTVATGATARVSLGADDEEADGSSRSPDIAGDGSWIGFESSAALVAGAESLGYYARRRAAGPTAWTSQTSALPPDPAVLAPLLPDDEPVPLGESVDFLFTGPTPLQTGVAEGTMQAERIAVLRGLAADAEGRGLPGVRVEVVDRPELGHTFTRTDGRYDLAVNGGGELTLQFSKPDHMPLQRTQDVPWQTYVNVEDVALNRYDPRATLIDRESTLPFQVAQGSTETDADGRRTATLLFPQGVRASMRMSDGSIVPLDDFTVRSTEYTTGNDGAESMPGELPATSAYTYAVEFSVDEAEEAGAAGVVFDRPVLSYTDNFLELPVGMDVPSAYYDRLQSAWVPAPNGVVLEFLGRVAGKPAVDTQGDGVADGAARLAELGISPAELDRLDQLYAPGKQLWRVPVRNFSPWDYNHPYGGPPGAGPPPGAPGAPGGPGSPCQAGGSIIFCQTQGLGEERPLVGTDISLRYSSEKVPGRLVDYTLEVPVSGDSVPDSLEQIHVQVSIAGRQFTRVLPAAPNQTASIPWDGKDAYGRPVVGAQTASVRVGNEFKTVYYATPEEFQSSFGTFGDTPLTASPTRDRITYWRESEMSVGGLGDLRWQGLGGWTLDVLHQYDPAASVVYLGDGTTQRSTGLANTISTLAGQATSASGGYSGDGGPATEASLGYVRGLDVAPDGTVFIADSGNAVIRAVSQDGTIRTVAGGGAPVDGLGDGGPATEAELVAPHDLAVARDGTLFIADTGNNRVRRVSVDGTITTVAGGGNPADGLGDSGRATAAELFRPRGIAVGDDGTLFIADTGNNRVRRVSPDGLITTSAGGGNPTDGIGDGGPGPEAKLDGPHDVAVNRDGVLYITDSGHNRVRELRPDGVITTFAGTGAAGSRGDGGPAVDASLGSPSGIAIARDGSITVSQRARHVVRRVDPGGLIHTIAGTGTPGFVGDEGLATEASLETPLAVAEAPDGTTYVADTNNFRVRRIMPALPGFGAADVAIPSADGTEVYRFDRSGRHLDTRHGLTGHVLWSFEYDAQRRLRTVTDAYGKVTTVERSASGLPTAIAAPGGQRTGLEVGPDGFLTGVRDPAGHLTTMEYAPGGLLTTMVEPGNRTHAFQYDEVGRLVSDRNPGGYVQTLDSTRNADSATVTLTSSSGRTTRYVSRNLGLAGASYTVIAPDGGSTRSEPLPDGGQRVTHPDGTRVETIGRADPRWRGLVSYPASIRTTTPSGLTRTETMTREVELADANDPFSVVSLVDTLGLNGEPNGSLSFDGLTRTLTRTDATDHAAVTELDPQGQPVTWQQDPQLAEVVLERDAQGRTTALTTARGSTAYGYDARGRGTSLTIAGRTSSRTYDDRDLITGFTTFGGHPVKVAHDPAGNRTAMTLPKGQVHSFGWSANRQVTAYDPPGPGQFTRVVDPEGLLRSETNPSGRQVQHDYDDGGRRTSTTAGQTTVSRTYDAHSRITEHRRATSGAPTEDQLVAHTFDGDLLTATEYTGLVDGAFRYAYDDRFLRTSTTFTQGGDTVGLPSSYDGAGRRTGVGPFSLTRGGPAGAISRISGSGATATYTYDSMWETESLDYAVGGASRYAYHLTRDARELVTSRTESIGGETSVYDYTYDDDGQLLEVERDGVVVETYSYDANGNRTSRTSDGGQPEQATFDDQDRIVSQGEVDYEFDADGFLVGRGDDSFSYSATGELLSATVEGKTIRYGYDGMGRRVARTDASGTDRYFYGDPDDPKSVTATRSAAGALTVYFYDEDQRLFAMVRDGKYFLVAADHLGSPRVVTTTTGSVVKQVTYDAYGNITGDSNPDFDLAIGFAGGLADEATGWVRHGRRDYDPSTGRWTARDPILFEGGQLNLYAYAHGSPVTFRDPGGLGVPGKGFWCAMGSGLKAFGGRLGFGDVYGSALQGGVNAAEDIENSDNMQRINELDYELTYGYPPPTNPQCGGAGGGGGGDGGGGDGGGC